MALDLNKVRSRIAQHQSKGKRNADGSFEKTDFTKIYWKPKVGEQVIRIVPPKTNPSYPIIEVDFHNGVGGKKRYLALTNFGETDPIVEFTKELKASDDKEDRDFGYKLSPKKRFFCQVLVRGEEDKGVRLWEFGVNVEKEILKLLNHKDYGDITDVNDGTDLTVEGVDDSFTNGKITQKYVRPDLTPNRKTSPLASREADINRYLNEQHDPLTLNKKYTYEEMKTLLGSWLEPKDGEEHVIEGTKEQIKDALDEHLEAEAETDVNALPFVETNEDTPPFESDPVVEESTKNAIKAASKKIIAKNNEELKTAKPVVKIKEKKEEKSTAKTAITTTGASKKEQFAALFKKKD